MPLLIGNLCSLLAMVTDAISASRKTAKSMLLVQILSQIIYGTGAIALKGYSAAVQNAVAILRNIAAIRKVQSKWVEWLLVALAVVLGLLFNNLGTIGLLPVVANFIYSVAIFAFKDNERVIKGAFAVNMAMLTVFILSTTNASVPTAPLIPFMRLLHSFPRSGARNITQLSLIIFSSRIGTIQCVSAMKHIVI
jgi:hypothetical protein